MLHFSSFTEIASKGLKHLTEAGKNVIIVDTAGRHKEEKELLKEMVKLNKKIKLIRLMQVGLIILNADIIYY